MKSENYFEKIKFVKSCLGLNFPLTKKKVKKNMIKNLYNIHIMI